MEAKQHTHKWTAFLSIRWRWSDGMYIFLSSFVAIFLCHFVHLVSSLCLSWVFFYVSFVLFRITFPWQNRSLGAHCWNVEFVLHCFSSKQWIWFISFWFVQKYARFCKSKPNSVNCLAFEILSNQKMNMFVFRNVCIFLFCLETTAKISVAATAAGCYCSLSLVGFSVHFLENWLKIGSNSKHCVKMSIFNASFYDMFSKAIATHKSLLWVGRACKIGICAKKKKSRNHSNEWRFWQPAADRFFKMLCCINWQTNEHKSQ